MGLGTIFRYGWKEDDRRLAGGGGRLFRGDLCRVVRPTVARLGERRTLYVGQLFGALGMVVAGLAERDLGYSISIP